MRLRYTLPALADLDSVLGYIAAHSPTEAKRVQSRLRRIIDLLVIHPHIGVLAEDPSVRRVVITPHPYLVFYEVTDTEIIIHAIRHAARDPSDMPGTA